MLPDRLGKQERLSEPFLFAVAFFTIVWFALLFGRPLFDPDEGRYAEIPREMLASGDWIIPHLNGLVYLEKPPLQYWATAVVYACFGISEGTARLATGCAGYSILVLVFVLARRLWGLRAAVEALLLTLGSILFVLLGHQLTLDMSLSACLFGCLTAFVHAQLRREEPSACRAWMTLSWAAMALAVLTKGLVGLVIPGFSLVVYVFWQGDLRLWRHLHFRIGIPVFLLVALPWFVLAARANDRFLWFFFVREHWQRFLTPIEMRSQPWWFFAPVLLLGVLPWVSQALRVLATGWRRQEPVGRFDARRLLWIWSVFVLVFFSASHSKLIPYILPAIPTLALLVAAPRPGHDRGHLLVGAVLTLCFAFGVLGFASGWRSSTQGLELVRLLRPALLATAGVLLAAGALSLRLRARRRPLGALAALCLGWFAAAVTITGGGFAVQGLYSAKDMAAAIVRANALGGDAAGVDAAMPVFTVRDYYQSLPFYLRHTVTLVDYHDEFTFGLNQAPQLGIADLGAFAARWRALSAGVALMTAATRNQLAGGLLADGNGAAANGVTGNGATGGGAATGAVTSGDGAMMRELADFPGRIVLISRR
jgi:4-amino-4-deoxy-L-arabinose transferase-like glycosyltransferase